MYNGIGLVFKNKTYYFVFTITIRILKGIALVEITDNLILYHGIVTTCLPFTNFGNCRHACIIYLQFCNDYILLDKHML